MTKTEAIQKVLEDNDGVAGWGVIYKQVERYYPRIKDSVDWKAGIRGVLYRDIRNGKRFKMLEEGVIGLLDYNELRMALAVDLQVHQGPTQITVQASIRRGQQRFRESLLKSLDISCPVTGLADKRLLVSSHIKPWTVSTDLERLDVNNGFLFSPTVDKLFDRGFISFTNDKELLISSELSQHSRQVLAICQGTRYQKLPIANRELYLEYHREYIFSE